MNTTQCYLLVYPLMGHPLTTKYKQGCNGHLYAYFLGTSMRDSLGLWGIPVEIDLLSCMKFARSNLFCIVYVK